MNDRPTTTPGRRRPVLSRLRWVFRIGAVLLSCGLVLVAELLCAAFGWGDLQPADDPFVEFSSVRPLFERTEDGRQFHTSPARRRYFKEDRFDAKKSADEFRIFVFGGSTVQGNPFSTETSFPSYLQIALSKACPDRSWKVVNCGGVSYASYRLLPVMQECLQYEPDLFIFCEGHNEFLEDVHYADVRQTSQITQALFAAMNQLRCFRIARQMILTQLRATKSRSQAEPVDVDSRRPLLPEEVDTLLDHDGGLAVYHRDDQHAQIVASHFESNLKRMAFMCRQRHVPLLMVLPPSSLNDCPPFKSEFSATLSLEQRSRINELLLEARAEAVRNLSKAIEQVQAAVEIDARYALAWYELGMLQMADRRWEDAELSLRRARDEDICPLRMTTPLEVAMEQVAKDSQVPLINAHDLLKARCATGIVGLNVLVDHVHPSFVSHEDIAIAIAEHMQSVKIFVAGDDRWQQATHKECQALLQELDNLYFLRGQRALENLQLWAAGRSGGPPLVPRP